MLHRFASVSALALVALLSQSAHATSLPLNHLDRFDRLDRINEIDERGFKEAADQVQAEFDSIVSSHGGKLVFNLHWEDPTVNAYASQPEGNVWQVDLFGGLARRPEITQDGFVMVACHELGHHLGGYPFKGDIWAASEGEADYFAAQVCTKRLWEREDNSRFRATASDDIQFACNMIYRQQSRRDLCYRISEAGVSLATLLSRLGGAPVDPSMKARDRRVVSRTDLEHPQAQCRLDTYLAGALCPVPFDLRRIPGKDEKEGYGTNTPETEYDALASSCAQETRLDPRYSIRYGARPRCWFNPLTREGTGSTGHR